MSIKYSLVMGRNRLVEGNDSFGGAQFRQDRWQRIHGEAWTTSSTTTGPSSPRRHGRRRAQWRRHPAEPAPGEWGRTTCESPPGRLEDERRRPAGGDDGCTRTTWYNTRPRTHPPAGPERFQAARGEGRGVGAWREVRTPKFRQWRRRRNGDGMKCSPPR